MIGCHELAVPLLPGMAEASAGYFYVTAGGGHDAE